MSFSTEASHSSSVPLSRHGWSSQNWQRKGHEIGVWWSDYRCEWVCCCVLKCSSLQTGEQQSYFHTITVHTHTFCSTIHPSIHHKKINVSFFFPQRHLPALLYYHHHANTSSRSSLPSALHNCKSSQPCSKAPLESGAWSKSQSVSSSSRWTVDLLRK